MSKTLWELKNFYSIKSSCNMSQVLHLQVFTSINWIYLVFARHGFDACNLATLSIFTTRWPHVNGCMIFEMVSAIKNAATIICANHCKFTILKKRIINTRLIEELSERLPRLLNDLCDVFWLIFFLIRNPIQPAFNKKSFDLGI